MTRHVADRTREAATTPARVLHFLRLARAEGRHPALRALHERRPAPPAEGRLAPFLRIARGRSA